VGSDVCVIAEQQRGRVADVTFEMLGKGRELSQGLGVGLEAVVLGNGVREPASALGAADTVLCVDDPRLTEFVPEAYQAVLAQLLRQRQPRLVLVGNTSVGMDLAAWLSAELGWPLAAYCSDLRVEGGQVVATSRIYGGKIAAEMNLGGGPAIAAVLAGAFPDAAGRLPGPARVEQLPAQGLERVRTRFRGLIEPEGADVDITKEPILVSVGRGIQDKENVELAVELAEALGGVVAASRPVVDNGWLPKSRQVGKSGLKVRPKLYLAVGISGAPEHVEGMRDAELIVAINTDPGAPIFDVAHYGTTADLFELLPVLTEKVRAARQARAS
jgi:electron transfer flavoprotein alpha subunit